MHGILLVDKPEGITSAAVVRIVKKTLETEKIGHLGTLDPFASGLLPLCLGAGTKIAQFLNSERKAYTGTVRLGVETDTYDRTGMVTHTTAVQPYDVQVLRDLEAQFSGEYWQTPPMYSAIKRHGMPLYKLARQGIEIEREPRRIKIETLRLTSTSLHTLHFSLVCSKGTYVRTLAVDIGRVLGCGAHLETLRRTAFGNFLVEDAMPLVQLRASQELQNLPLLSLRQALQHYRTVSVSEEMTDFVRQGRQEVLNDLPSARTDGEIAQLIGPKGDLVAMVQNHLQCWQLLRVFSTLQ